MSDVNCPSPKGSGFYATFYKLLQIENRVWDKKHLEVSDLIVLN